MKKFVFIFLCCILFLFFICFPHAAVSASKQGLRLWFTQILPTLLPFCVLSYVILRSEILPKKFSTCYIVLCGFLFGFPIGCKLTADFYSSNYISREKASALCCFTNNLSPVFVITALQEILQLPLSPVYVFLILWHSVFVWNEYAVIISQNPFFYTKRNGIKISYGYANH